MLRTDYRPDLQGLRAIAIILVVLAHAGVTLLPGGFVGVDVFFVLSGFLITRLLIREYCVTGNISLVRFMARRLQRLLPALYLMLCIVSIFSLALLSNFETVQQTASIRSAVTWTSNMYFALTAVDYFAELQTKDFFLHTWSLGVEEQFYLFWPLLLLISFSFLKWRELLGGDRRVQLSILFVASFLSSLGLSWYWSTTYPQWSFYMMPARIWQFSLGALVAVWLHPELNVRQPSVFLLVGPMFANWLRIFGLLLILGSAALLSPQVSYPGFWALIPSIGTFFIIVAGHFGNLKSKHGLDHPGLVWVGDHAYSWYLWHWPVLMLGSSFGIQHTLVGTVGLVSSSLLLAMISYRYVEYPFWKGALSRATPKRITLLSILAMLTIFWGEQRYLDLKPVDRALPTISFAAKARLDFPIIYAQGCDAWYRNSDVRPCEFGEKQAPRTVVLLGDSIGAQWFSLLPELFKSPEWRIVVLTKSSCPMVDEEYFYSRIGKTYTVCTEWRNAALNYLDSIHPDVVFVGGTADSGFSKKQWIEGSARVMARLGQAARRVFVLPGTPALTFDGPGCLERHFSTEQKRSQESVKFCSEASEQRTSGHVAQYLEQAVRSFPNVKVLNLNDLVCPEGQCSAVNSDGVVVFRDHQHLTDSFVRAQAQKVRGRIKLIEPGFVDDSSISAKHSL